MAEREEAERELEAARRSLLEARRKAAHAQSDYFRGLSRDQQQAREAYYSAFREELEAEDRLRRAEERVRTLGPSSQRPRVRV
jgi:hypothetical protein